MDLNALAHLAAQGDRAALERLCLEVRDPIYRLALRTLGSPHDAEDAAQEILIQVVTHLGQFQGRAQLMTWVYTIATRSLLRTRRRAAEDQVRGAEPFAQWLDSHLADPAYGPAEKAELHLLEEECRLACTQGMLLCLTREHRIALLLGDVLKLSDREGAQICEVSRATFRQRLARARKTIRLIIGKRCGLVDPGNSCSCSRQIGACVQAGIMDPQRPVFAHLPRVGLTNGMTLTRGASQLNELERFAELIGSEGFQAPESVWAQVRLKAPDLVT
ncbi:RNA polymerase sigma factor [Deinococcus deserti]|uniref:Putative RNA polymerase sigma factor, ECF subfamily n=1 Tax=Deinococcus deserti (strain DSM 17065 / CIP 109153 / LMG 22923 / VCD115) TaxID=546414 RepID=C1D081_DEIDV|nr:RNA polymerase sigma factor [Deinococcus deserti]ACO47350.1 putative RNA polymerase sigma factor, ECF subfamily [Deinococcus deserti VCD115]